MEIENGDSWMRLVPDTDLTMVIPDITGIDNMNFLLEMARSEGLFDLLLLQDEPQSRKKIKKRQKTKSCLQHYSSCLCCYH